MRARYRSQHRYTFLRDRRRKGWRRVIGDATWVGVCAAVLTGAVAFGPARDAGAAGEPVYECATGEGHTVTLAWGAAGPPEGWSPAENACVVIGENPGPDREWSSDAFVEVLPDVWLPAAEAGPVVEFLDLHYRVTEFLRAHSVQRWYPLADCESGGDWSVNTGNGYSGGLQLSPVVWAAMGGLEYAPAAYLAEPWQQVVVADRLHDYEVAQGRGGYGPWPGCARALGWPR